MTHTVTHTGKRAGGNNGDKRVKEYGMLDGKGHERPGKQKTSPAQSVGKDEVSGSNPDSSPTKQLIFWRKAVVLFVFATIFGSLNFGFRL